MTDDELDRLYKAGAATNHLAALRAVFTRGREWAQKEFEEARALLDAKTKSAPVTPATTTATQSAASNAPPSKPGVKP